MWVNSEGVISRRRREMSLDAARWRLMPTATKPLTTSFRTPHKDREHPA